MRCLYIARHKVNAQSTHVIMFKLSVRIWAFCPRNLRSMQGESLPALRQSGLGCKYSQQAV